MCGGVWGAAREAWGKLELQTVETGEIKMEPGLLHSRSEGRSEQELVFLELLKHDHCLWV